MASCPQEVDCNPQKLIEVHLLTLKDVIRICFDLALCVVIHAETIFNFNMCGATGCLSTVTNFS